MGFFNKIWSGLDFWQGDENRKQRDQFALKEEEERKRRERLARERALSGTPPPAPTQPMRQPEPTFDFSQPLKKSAFGTGFNNPIFNTPQSVVPELEKAGTPSSGKNRFFKTLAAPFLSAGRVATGIGQGASGFWDLISPGKGNSRVTKGLNTIAEGYDKAARDLDVEGLYKTLNVPGEIGSYFIPGVLPAKAANASSRAARVVNAVQRGANRAGDFVSNGASPFGRFIGRGMKRSLSPEELVTEAAITSKFIGENTARGNPTTAESLFIDVASGIPLGTLFGGLRKAERALEGDRFPEVDPVAKELDEATPTPSQPKPTEVDGKPALEVEEGIISVNVPKVPDPTSPIALAKAAESAGMDGNVPIASFNNPVNGSQLPKASGIPKAPSAPSPEMVASQQQLSLLDTPPPEIVPAKAAVGPTSAVDATGNPVLKSDLQRAQEMADAGMAPARGGSVVDQIEGERQAAAKRAVDEEVINNPASIRERENFAAAEQDSVLAQEIIDSVPKKARLNVEESLSAARQNARSQSPEQLVASWSGERVLDQNNPQAWINALEERRVLNAMVSENVPGAREARLNIADAMSRFQSKSGQNLNILKAAYDEMPTDMKTELLVKKIDRARKEAGMNSLTDAEMSELFTRVESAGGAENRLRAIEEQAADFNRAITTGSATPAARQRLAVLKQQREEALADLYTKNAEVTDYFAKLSPDNAFGQKLANWNRVSMLSSVTGRLFDMVATTFTNVLDTGNRALSSLFARGMKKGAAKTKFPQLFPSATDLKKAGQRTADSARGKNQVRDVLAEIQGLNTGRGELQNRSTGRFRNLVKAGTEAPTEVTRYIEADDIRRAGYKRADELGLKGDDADLYADSYESVATAAEKYSAQQEHLKANMLHNNAVSGKIEAVANVMLKSDNAAGKSVGAVLKSIVAPFTRFIGGMTHRTFTDMNVIHNAWQIRKAIKNGDAQMLSDALAKLTTNTAVGFATATVLANTGVLTDKDANGDSYAGLYVHAGDRYIPAGFFGLFSIPMIVGYGINKAFDADSPVDAFTSLTTDTLARVMASTSTAGFFGADNVLQTAIGTANSAISPSETGGNERGWADLAGSTVRQSIPAITNDINSIINQIPAFNPTGEMAETKVLNEDGTQNPLATQAAKTINALPGFSQTLPRREGVPARDFIDRATKGNRETGEMAEGREVKESLKDWKKRLEDGDIPVTVEKISDLAKTGDYDKAVQGAEYHLAELEADEDATENSKINARRDLEDYQFGQKFDYVPSSNEAVETRAEQGNYAAAVAGWQLRLERDEEDGNTPESKLNAQRNKIKRYEIFRDRNIAPNMAIAYEKTDSDDGGVGVTAWRDMMESGDSELVAYAEQLYNLDKALLDAGAIKEQKYYWGKGGRGGGSSFSTDIATLSTPGYSFSPFKAREATFGQRQSAIPRLEKVANYSRQPKKISIKKGNRI